MERFWSKVNKTDTCWVWTGAKIPDGYGSFYFDGRPRLAHRVSWYLMDMPEIPDDRVLDHLCRNRLCVNPDHIRIATYAENAPRGSDTWNGKKTHCKHGHEFTPGNTGIHAGKRYCRTCRNRWSRNYRAQRSAIRGLASTDPVLPERTAER